LRTALSVGLIRGFKTDAVVRATFVVKVNEGLNTLFGLLITLVAPFFVDYLCLENAVYTLCNGVVCGFIILCHTDAYIILIKQFYISIATVLDATVGVVR
jgi:hypothetical protein